MAEPGDRSPQPNPPPPPPEHPAPANPGTPQASSNDPSRAPIVWTAEARQRVENAPAFVRAGILKLTELRARERGLRAITSEFLTEIRNESMLRVSKSIKKFGFEELSLEAFEVAKEKMRRHPRKVEVIGEIQEFLAQRTERNQEIMEKFARYLEIVPKQGIPWTMEALRRLEVMPPFARRMAKEAVEEQARKSREVVISSTFLAKVLNELLPDARRFMSALGGALPNAGGVGDASGAPASEEAAPDAKHLAPLESLPITMPWEEEPLRRVRRVPLDFIRERLIRRVEAYARRQDTPTVTLAHFTTARFLPDDEEPS
ncbi:MAG: PCP reductase family protein [Candidatus Tectomicrobia bacterium]|nr:PCP reductase family protein [Candidatus Tectomicrobia bacterium]